MNSQEILKKAIRKAIDGGWKPFADLVFDAVSKDGSGYAWCGHWERYVQMELNGNLPPDYRPVARTHDLATERLIFNHDFAKALWGDKELELYEYANDQFLPTAPAWQYHLQEMVIADDPIKYLGENL